MRHNIVWPANLTYAALFILDVTQKTFLVRRIISWEEQEKQYVCNGSEWGQLLKDLKPEL